MKKNILFAIAFITHPILLPPIFYLIMTSFKFNLELSFVLNLSIIIPIALFRIAKVNFRNPSLTERRIVYLVLVICYAAIQLYLRWNSESAYFSSINMFQFLSIALLIFSLTTYIGKWSWHAFAWAGAMWWTLAAANEFSVLETRGVLLFILTVVVGLLVCFIRYLQKAHSIEELLLGYLTGGILLPIISLILM